MLKNMQEICYKLAHFAPLAITCQKSSIMQSLSVRREQATSDNADSAIKLGNKTRVSRHAQAADCRHMGA